MHFQSATSPKFAPLALKTFNSLVPTIWKLAGRGLAPTSWTEPCLRRITGRTYVSSIERSMVVGIWPTEDVSLSDFLDFLLVLEAIDTLSKVTLLPESLRLLAVNEADTRRCGPPGIGEVAHGRPDKPPLVRLRLRSVHHGLSLWWQHRCVDLRLWRQDLFLLLHLAYRHGIHRDLSWCRPLAVYLIRLFPGLHLSFHHVLSIHPRIPGAFLERAAMLALHVWWPSDHAIPARVQYRHVVRDVSVLNSRRRSAAVGLFVKQLCHVSVSVVGAAFSEGPVSVVSLSELNVGDLIQWGEDFIDIRWAVRLGLDK